MFLITTLEDGICTGMTAVTDRDAVEKKFAKWVRENGGMIPCTDRVIPDEYFGFDEPINIAFRLVTDELITLDDNFDFFVLEEKGELYEWKLMEVRNK